MPTLRERLYHLPPPNRTRTKPLEVLALGLSRSGTDSLRTALDMLGYENTYHSWLAIPQPADFVVWSELAVRKFESHDQTQKSITATDFDRVLGHSTAVTDTPCAVFAAELVAAYPDAMVILNTRKDVDKWYESWLATIQPWHDDWWRPAAAWFSRSQFWLWRGFKLVNMHYYRHDFRASGKWVYREHSAMIRGLVSKERLLEWSVDDGWEPLCAFLGKPVPEEEFPRTNAGGDFAARAGMVMVEYDREAKKNIAIFAGVLAAAVAGIWTYLYVGVV